MERPPVIDARSVHVHYGCQHAIKGVSLPIHERCITALIGASGSGKSTLLRSLNRMLDTVPGARVEGEIHFGGRDVAAGHIDVTELRRRVGMVFQNPTPFPMSIYDNVAYGLRIQGIARERAWSERIFGARRRRQEAVEASADPLDRAVVESLKEAALWDEVGDRLHHSAFRLSGGQQQRLCIARAIAVRPHVLLLDEPCSALDPIAAGRIEELLLRLKDRYAIVIVTHNLQQARRIADHVAFLHLGELVEFGPTEQVFGDPRHPLTGDYVRGVFG